MTPTVDVDRLIAPVPGDDPAGKPVSFVLRQKLDAARKSINPAEYAANDPLRPTEAKPADWPGIIDTCVTVLAEESKDLMIAARLTEALTKAHGFAGLRDGTTVLRRLVAEAWDRLTPPIEDGDLDVRAGQFSWLDDPDRGARFPASVRSVPLVNGDDGLPISWLDWKTAQSTPANPDIEGDNPQAAFQAKFDKAVAGTDRAAVQDMVDALVAATAELDAAETILLDRMGDSAPGVGEWRKAMADALDMARRILEKKGPAPVSFEPSAEPAADAPAASANGTPTATAPRLLTREDAYRQMATAAALLQQLEPHSPIPYMVQRAVALGSLPFPELMKVMIRDPSVVSQLTRELGLPGDDGN
jgi:type VI secretion system protein ImpA